MTDDAIKNTAGACQPPIPSFMMAKRAQILEGAGKIFLACGYEGASMSQIAREAGVSKGTLYNHFDGKASLFSAFFEERARNGIAPFEELSRDDGLCPRDALARFAEMSITLVISPTALGLYRIIVGEAEKFPNLVETFWTCGFTRKISHLTHWLKRCVARRELDIPDPGLAAEQFLAMCQTRIVQRKRLMLPVDDSPEAVRKFALLAADSFLKIYAPRHQ